MLTDFRSCELWVCAMSADFPSSVVLLCSSCCSGAAPSFGSASIKGGSHLELRAQCCRDPSNFPWPEIPASGRRWNAPLVDCCLKDSSLPASMCDRNVASVKRFILPNYWLKKLLDLPFFCRRQRPQTLFSVLSFFITVLHVSCAVQVNRMCKGSTADELRSQSTVSVWQTWIQLKSRTRARLHRNRAQSAKTDWLWIF